MDRKMRNGVDLSRTMLAMAALVLIVIIGISRRQWRHNTIAPTILRPSLYKSLNLDALQSSLIDAKTGQRGLC